MLEEGKPRFLVGLADVKGGSPGEAVLPGAVLAPTDAALGQALVSNPLVPVRVRQGLNVESGLNDGIALPVVLVAVAFAGATGESDGLAHWLSFAIPTTTPARSRRSYYELRLHSGVVPLKKSHSLPQDSIFLRKGVEFRIETAQLKNVPLQRVNLRHYHIIDTLYV